MTKLIYCVDFIWKQYTSALNNGTRMSSHMTKLCDDNPFATCLRMDRKNG